MSNLLLFKLTTKLNIPSVRVLKQGVEQAQREKCALEITNTIFPPPPTHTRSRTHTLLCNGGSLQKF